MPVLKISSLVRDFRRLPGQDHSFAKWAAIAFMDLDFKMESGMEMSATLRHLEPIVEEDARKWIRYLRAEGFLSHET